MKGGEEFFINGRTYLLEGNDFMASEAFDKAVAVDKAYAAKVIDEYYNAGKTALGFYYIFINMSQNLVTSLEKFLTVSSNEETSSSSLASSR